MATKLLDLDEQRRNAILNASLKEFAARGFDAASTNIIAKEAGISKALMFHYVNSKKEIFLFTYDYFTDLMDKEYFGLMNFKETDIFERLHQSYLLQIKLLIRYPWIFELNKLSAATQSDDINHELEVRKQKKQTSCYTQLSDGIDVTKFRQGLDIEMCKQFIYWSNNGFLQQLLNDIRNSNNSEADYESILTKLNGYFDELKKIFYL
jgi:Transcriptional regulator